MKRPERKQCHGFQDYIDYIISLEKYADWLEEDRDTWKIRFVETFRKYREKEEKIYTIITNAPEGELPPIYYQTPEERNDV